MPSFPSFPLSDFSIICFLSLSLFSARTLIPLEQISLSADLNQSALSRSLENHSIDDSIASLSHSVHLSLLVVCPFLSFSLSSGSPHYQLREGRLFSEGGWILSLSSLLTIPFFSLLSQIDSILQMTDVDPLRLPEEIRIKLAEIDLELSEGQSSSPSF